MDASAALDRLLDTLLSTDSSDMVPELTDYEALLPTVPPSCEEATSQSHPTSTDTQSPGTDQLLSMQKEPHVAAIAQRVSAADTPKREVKCKVVSSYESKSAVEMAPTTVAEMRRAQNRRHAAASRKRKFDALQEALSEGSRLKEQGALLAKALREASAALEYVFECVEDLPTEHRNTIVIKRHAFRASRSVANSALKGL